MSQNSMTGDRKTENPPATTGGSSREKAKFVKTVSIAAILVIATTVLLITFLPTAIRPQIANRDNLPPAYQSNARTEAAYLFIVDHQAQAAYMACYCGCKNIPHYSLKNCFIKENGTWEGHGAGCALCVDIATDFTALVTNGTTLLNARNILDAKYQSWGPGTDTPMPPS